MKKSRQLEILVISISFAGAGAYLLYESWPNLFPEFAVGVCLEHKRSGRQYELVEDRYSTALDVGVPARILKTGVALPGDSTPGSIERLSVDDPHLKIITCPHLSI